MAFVGLAVPAPTARLLAEIDLNGMGEKEPPSSYHVTMFYAGKNVPIEKIAAMIEPIFGVVSNTKPFTAATSHATTFPPNPDDGVPIIARVDSNELHTLRGSIAGAFKKAGVDFSEKYPFTPHVTLAYAQDPMVHADNAVDVHFPTIEWGVHELCLWGGDNGDNRLIVTFPLSIAPIAMKTAKDRAFVQLAKNWPAPTPKT